MRIQGWSKLGYYPTPERVTDLVAGMTQSVLYSLNRQDHHPEIRIMDPCCGAGDAVARFAAHLQRRARTATVRTYGIELDRERSRAARRQLFQVWHADIDHCRLLENAYHILWLNPPYDWASDDDADGSRRLESRFLHQATQGLAPNGLLIYIIPQHVLAWDAAYLSRNYQEITVGRFPDPEYDAYRQVVVMARRKEHLSDRAEPETIRELASLAPLGSALEPLSVPGATAQAGALDLRRNEPRLPESAPVRVLRHPPEAVVQAMSREGVWQLRELQTLFSTAISPVRIRPIEPLPAGHAAMVAANSMMDNILIKDPAGVNAPIVIRGFFRKRSRETFRSETIVKRTDFFESNIRALDVTTGRIDEVGDSPEKLKEFMTKHGPAIRSHIATAYPPAIATDTPQAELVKARIAALSRPLIGKQVDAAVIGALQLSRRKHLNLFATQGSGKTCTANGIARGLNAAKVAVVTPARVVPNWVDEIRAVSPNAIIRVVTDQNPIGTRRPLTPYERTTRPAPFGRASLEAIRRLEPWATPETPLWIILKKDSCRTTYPVVQGLRTIGAAPEAAYTPHRPLARLAEAEQRLGRRHGPAIKFTPQPKRLYRTASGQLQQLPADAAPLGTCPRCWFPLTDAERWNPRDRDSRCLNPTQTPRYPNATVTDPEADPEADPETAPEFHQCQEPIATAVRTGPKGRAVYAYGDYLARYLNRWLDLLIIDEAQDYKGRDTAQGQTIRRMAQKARKTLALTGTPFGGKVSEVFYMLLASDPAFSREFGYRDMGTFLRLYGRQEFTYDLDDSPGHSIGASSRRRETRSGTAKEIPGYHPALLEHFWHNTIFMQLNDVDPEGQLPPFTQQAELVPLDTTEQEAAGLSQSAAYHRLDTEFKAAVSAELQLGSKRLLGAYLHEMLVYPENCWQGAEPRNGADEPIITIPPLDAKRLYPKEARLLEVVNEQRAQGRKCLVYCTHTDKRDTTGRLQDLLQQHGIRALQLKAGTVKSEQRTGWLQNEAQYNDVIICQPRLVETGVNLLEYPTIIWYEVAYSMFTTEQASARSYRINQTQPVAVYYFAYADTMQERALRIIARKADVSRTFHGDLSKNGLSAFNPDPDDIREQLARELLSTNGARSPRRDHPVAITFTNHSVNGAGNKTAGFPKPHPAVVAPAPPPQVKRYSNAGAVQGSLFD